MVCANCGKVNPEGAAFCAFCGQPIQDGEESVIIDSQLVDEEENGTEEDAGRGANDAHTPYMRPDPARQVKPLPENPAQPTRRERRQAQEEQEREAVDSGQSARHAGPVSPQRQMQSPVRGEAQKLRHETERPPSEKSASKREAKPAEPRREAPRPVRGAVGANGRIEDVPARKAPIKPSKNASWERVNTLIPKRKKRPQDDLFFEDIDQPGERAYDEEEDELVWPRRIKSAAAGLFLLAVLSFVFWLLILPGGQVFRASMGMGAPASAYAGLGDRYLGENSVKRAADAYYDALRLDPNNYDFAFKVARTQALVGERNKALAAYAKCIELKGDQWEPYQAVAELYEQMGDLPRAANALKAGYDRTGNLDLFRAYEEVQAKVTA